MSQPYLFKKITKTLDLKKISLFLKLITYEVGGSLSIIFSNKPKIES